LSITCGGKMALAKIAPNTNAHGKIEMLTPCPPTPNCVSSVDKDPQHFVEPLHFTGSINDAQDRLLGIVSNFKRARVVTVEDNLIRTEFVSLVFRFTDDVEFYFDARNKIIHLKSASRVGYFDLGVNRRRIEKIRTQFNPKK
jgi:uncharacterized protein (DUF1499 family)